MRILVRGVLSKVAPIALTAVLVLTGCSGGEGDDGNDSSNPTGSQDPSTDTTSFPDTTVLVGDDRCGDPEGDVYLTGDETAAPTGRAPGIDIVYAKAELLDDELSVRFETLGPVGESEFPEFIVFGGGATGPDHFELRASRTNEDWVVRRVRFVDDVPQEEYLPANVEVKGTVITYSVDVSHLTLGEFLSFAFASTGRDGNESVNDECFPFANRDPLIE